jgi:hydroxyethylthiazole kinase-like uncharacterized protein yjeF
MERVQDLPKIPPREPDTHKGTYGRVLIVAGSPAMPGAAILAARAALRGGCGLLTLAIEPALSSIAGATVPEATQMLLADGGAPATGTALTAKFDALAAGPGIGTSDAPRKRLAQMLTGYGGPHVLDADALNIVAEHPDVAGPRNAKRVWTPHPGEFQRLTGEKPHGDVERIAAAERFVERFGGVCVLKGRHTVITDGERYQVNGTGNPGMATGGAGDVLTGVIASFLGQGFPPFDAARLGVYLHGLAGDLAAREVGEVSLIASDITEHLPAAILQHQRPS